MASTEYDYRLGTIQGDSGSDAWDLVHASKNGDVAVNSSEMLVTCRSCARPDLLHSWGRQRCCRGAPNAR